MYPIPKGVNEANLDHFLFKIHSITAEGLRKASLYHAKISIEGDDQITKWTTPVDNEVSKNPKWHKEMTIMINKINLNRGLVCVMVKIYKKKAGLDKCVGEARVPVGERIDYERERFLLLRSKFHVRKAKGAIKLSCHIGAPAFSGMTQPGSSYPPPPPAYYQPMPQQPPTANALGLATMGANILGSVLPDDVIPSDCWGSFGLCCFDQ